MPEIKLKTEDGKVLTIIAKDGKDGAPGEKGESIKGQDGKTPTKTELVSLIKPLIPEPKKGKDGKTPTKTELVSIIKPLIPKPIKGDKGDPGQQGSSDTPAQVKEKILIEGITYKDIKDAPDVEHIVQVYAKQASKTVSLVELDDVDYSGLTFTNGKYILGSGGGGGSPAGSSGALQYNNSGAFGGFGSFNGTNALNLSGISITSAGVTTNGIFQQSGDQATFDVAGSSFAVKTTLYPGYGLINADNTGIVSIGDFFGDVNNTYIFLDDASETVGYKADNGHMFTGDMSMSSTTYPSGLFKIEGIGNFKLGDVTGDVNQTNINGDDGSKIINYRADNGHTFTGGLTLNAFTGGGTQYLTVDNSGVVGVSAGSGGGLTVGTTAIASGTTTRILYDNAGTLGEYTITGTGTVVAMQTSPTFVTDITTPLVIGGTSSGGNLTLRSTSHATKGAILMGAVSEYDEVNERLGIGTLTPQSRVDITTNNLVTTQTNTSGLLLANTTAATAGVVRQISPAARWRANAWKSNATAASQTVDFRQWVNATNGTATVTGDMVWESSINGGAYTTLMGLGSSGVLTFYTANTRVIDVSASSTSIIGLRIQNSNNSTASSIARNEITVGGSSGGDPQTNYVVSGATDWVTGIDNSDSDSFKLSQNATLGTNDRFIMTTAGLFSLRTGLSTKRATVGGGIKEYFTSVGNVTTGEDDLFTYTTEANIFGTNGDNIKGQYSGRYAANANNKTIRLYFAGTALLDSGALANSDVGWRIDFTLIRVSATVVRYSVHFNYDGNANDVVAVGELTGLTLSGTNILKITGEATATNDIVATMGTVTANPVSI